MNKISKLPAIPLITHDPFFSIWASGIAPTSDYTRHWSGVEKFLRGMLTVDGTQVRFLGRAGRRSMKCVDTEITPLSTRYVFEDMGVRLTLRFTSPLLMQDLEILSVPVSYVEFQLEHIDGKPHEVQLEFMASENNCREGNRAAAMWQNVFADEQGLKFAYMGQKQQAPLNGSGDHVTIDWGYMLFATDDGELPYAPNASPAELLYVKESTEPFRTTLLVGYDDIASIHYFGQLLSAYYARNGKTIVQAMKEFHDRQEEILAMCAAFDEELLREAWELGGEAYATIAVASYRQSVAAHKLVADREGNILFISKENDSNGCAATVDVSYPSVPLYLLYCPELVRGMLRPVLKFARMPIWHYDFAPHDVGRYPVLNGQDYASRFRPISHGEGCSGAPYHYLPSTVDAYDPRSQMPVEECGNMLLMIAAVCSADGDWTMAKENLDLLQMWSKYLIEYGENPGEQLCTDDFAGHMAANVNLSAKATMGVAAFSMILEKLGHGEEALSYMEKARAMGESWLRRAQGPEHSWLSFEGTGWSQKYNLVWDKLFGWNILPLQFYEQELGSYLPKVNEFGLPLDSRADYTKSDWTMWVAAMAEDRATFDALCKPLANFLVNGYSREPFSDFYDTVMGTCEKFVGRSVQGGCFMPLLMRKWRK